jgi:hypothetical protein
VRREEWTVRLIVGLDIKNFLRKISRPYIDSEELATIFLDNG